MKRSTYISLVLYFILLGISACRKDTLMVNEEVQGPDTSIKFETWVLGLVVDENEEPLMGARITLGRDFAQSDKQGVFRIKGRANQIQPFITVEKSGYYPSIVSFSSKAGQTGRVKATLVKKQLSGTLQSAVGGTISVTGGGSLVFAQNAFKMANGQPYDGLVHVYATYIDPSKPDHTNRVPGTFQGMTSSGDQAVLKSYGMMKVLIETPSGQALQLQKEAEMTMPIPADRLGSAPETIPLWFIDPVSSMWIEEGSAKRNGNLYTGTVSHFSWWNCDLPLPLVKISGQLAANTNLPFFVLKISVNGWVVRTTLSSDGYFEGPVPANQSLLFEIIDECGAVIHSTNYGPYSSDTDIGTIHVSSTANQVQISGTLLDCDNNPVSNGYILVRVGSHLAFPLPINPVTGIFNSSITSCNQADIVLVGYDLDALKSSDPIIERFAPVIELAQVIACEVKLGLTIEYADKKVYYPIDAFELSENDNNVLAYLVKITDNQEGINSLQFEFELFNIDYPNTNQWYFFYSLIKKTGAPIVYEPLGQATGNAIIHGVNPGDLIHIEFHNVMIREEPSGTLHNNAKMTFIGLLE